jgi:protein SCO1/2
VPTRGVRARRAGRRGRLGGLAIGVLLVAGCAGGATPSPSGGSSPSPATGSVSYLLDSPRQAPPIELTDSTGSAFSLSSLQGSAVLVSFGYTHCPDVCPATVGIIGQVITALAPDVAAVFVTIDPQRDTTASLAEYVRYLAPGYHAATGTAAQIRATADAWGVRYARTDGESPGEYGMSHTADVFLVDRRGLLRARFPFGIQSGAMTAVVRAVLQGPEPTLPAVSPGTPTEAIRTAPPETIPPEAEMGVEVATTSVWAGGASPVILVLSGPDGRIDDPSAVVSVQLETRDNAALGFPVAAVAVRPPGEASVSYVATLDVPTPGWWRLAVTARTGGVARAGSTDVAVLDPGATAALGRPAPTIHTPTLTDVGNVALAVTTDPAPDLRLSRTSTSDALAAGEPFVLVVDSSRFRTTEACGKALVLVRFLLDRWSSVAFIHLEPFRYSVQTDTAILDGPLTSPTLVAAANAWGIGASPWGALSMPWIFVVDGHGIVRAKYQGIIGSDDIDVLLSLIEQGG